MSPARIRYDGSVCLNVRSVSAACRSLGASVPSAEPMGWAELGNVLWFVETCATSRRLYFDGTVPRDTVQGAVEQVGLLKRGCDVPRFDVEPIRFAAPEKALAAARAAAAESRLLIERLAIDPAVDAPLPAPEHERFVRELRAAPALRERERAERTLEWVTDAFRGSKCLAAIVASGDGMIRAVLDAYERYGDRDPAVTAALINRFRLNYVNELAAGRRSAYVPDPAFEVITRQHVRLFKDYLLERLVNNLQGADAAPNLLVENLRAQTPLPPIGLYALMATRAAGRPGAVLETAWNEFRGDEGLMRLLWSGTRGGLEVRAAHGGDDGPSEIEAYFYDHYKRLEKEAEGIQVLTRRGMASTYLIPALLKGLAKAIPEALGVSRVWDVLYAALREAGVEASIPFLSDRLLAGGCDSYISQYRSLKWDLRNDDAVRKPLRALGDQVQRVFGRPLAPA
jgi:hypothetical protein